MVKILCVSDIVDPLVYSSNLKKRYGDVDFIVSSGDLQLNYYGFIVSLLNKPLYFIFGNHHLTHLEDFSKKCKNFDHFKDADDLTKNYFGSTYIGEGVVRDKNTGLLLAGFGGSLCYNKGEHQYSELQMRLRILFRLPKMLFYRICYGRWIDIVVTHSPPFGIHDRQDLCHRGFKSFLWFMRVFKPRYLLHGHIHLLDMNEKRETLYESTKVVNVYSSYVLEVESGYGG